jgi:hypothetical protein
MLRRPWMKEEKENEEISETLDFNKPTYEFIPKGSHEWTQRGPYLVCKSCELEHATWIGMELIMIGLSEGGQPILKRR